MVMILIGQALVCYLPAHVWKSFEAGLLKDLCNGLGGLSEHREIYGHEYKCIYVITIPFRIGSMIGRDGWTEQKKKLIAYFCSKHAAAVNTKYAYRYALCKAMSLITIVSSFFH